MRESSLSGLEYSPRHAGFSLQQIFAQIPCSYLIFVVTPSPPPVSMLLRWRECLYIPTSGVVLDT